MLDKAIFGSTTERVVRRAPCPVLTVRPTEHCFVAGEWRSPESGSRRYHLASCPTWPSA
jgi:hypothetical protein